MRSVLPLETRSTIASASPSRGASSTEPCTSTSSIGSGSSSRASRGKLVATRAPREIVERLHGRLGRHRGLERARAEAEPRELADVGAALPHDVEAGDAAVDDAVLHVLGDVVGAHEQRLDRRVAAREGERAVARRLGPEPGVVEELDRRLAEPALRRDRDSQELVRRRRRSASAYPPSPLRSHCATRVTVVVEACARRATSRYGSPSVQQLRHLPAVRHRVQLRPRAEVPQEALHLVRLPERGDRREELAVLLRRPMSGLVAVRVAIVLPW